MFFLFSLDPFARSRPAVAFGYKLFLIGFAVVNELELVLLDVEDADRGRKAKKLKAAVAKEFFILLNVSMFESFQYLAASPSFCG